MKTPRNNPLHVRVDDALLADLTEMAANEDRSVASLLAILLREAVATRKAKAALEQAAPEIQAAPEKKAARRGKL